MSTSTKPANASNTRIGCITLIVVGLAIGGAIALFSGGSSGAKYTATVSDFTAVNPADLAVTLKITNSGSKSGKPTCTVQANDPSYTYTGIDVGDLTDPIAQGATITTVMNLTISKQGAQYVTNATAKCS